MEPQPNIETASVLNANLSLAATPVVRVVSAAGVAQTVSGIAENGGDGFSFVVTVALPYEALSNLLQPFLHGKIITLTRGFINQQIVLEGCKLSGDGQQKLIAAVPFSGTYNGTFFISGIPFYNAITRRIELQNTGYDLQTQSLILKGAKWLFGNVILEQLKKHTGVDLTAFYNSVTLQTTAALNKQWAKGIVAEGTVKTISIVSIEARQNQLLVQAQCSGDLTLTVSELVLKF